MFARPALKKKLVRIRCRSTGGAHALRHELDRLGALSRRCGTLVTTIGSARLIAAAKRRAKHSVHHGRSR